MPKVTWFCDVCGAPWNSCEEAVVCEHGHTHVKDIISEEYDPNELYYHEPYRIRIRASDGKIVTYDKSVTEWQ